MTRAHARPATCPCDACRWQRLVDFARLAFLLGASATFAVAVTWILLVALLLSQGPA